MKKKLILMAMLTVVLAICFTGCPNPVQKTIIVTGIPSTTGYNYGYVGLVSGTGDNVKVVAISFPVKITNGQITCDLLDPKANPFTDEGTFSVGLIISSDANGDTPVYSGAIISKKITDEVTTIPFNSFISATSSVLSLQVKELLEK